MVLEDLEKFFNFVTFVIFVSFLVDLSSYPSRREMINYCS